MRSELRITLILLFVFIVHFIFKLNNGLLIVDCIIRDNINCTGNETSFYNQRLVIKN